MGINALPNTANDSRSHTTTIREGSSDTPNAQPAEPTSTPVRSGEIARAGVEVCDGYELRLRAAENEIAQLKSVIMALLSPDGIISAQKKLVAEYDKLRVKLT